MTVVREPGTAEVTQLLHRVQNGDRMALDRLLVMLYDELKRVARRQLNRERSDHTLDATALVHEAYLKLADPAGLAARDRAHLLAIAARAMRQVLVDHARRRNADKRGGGWERTTLHGKNPLLGNAGPDEILALNDALEQLEPRQREVVEYRFFAGLTEEEIAQVLGVSTRTVRRDWVTARAWLYSSLYPARTQPSA